MSAYYAQTDSLQPHFYAQADFSFRACYASVGSMSIPEKIRAIRAATGWTQQEFAAAAEVSQSTVNRWLTGSEPEGHRRDKIDELYSAHVAAPGKGTKLAKIVGKAGAATDGRIAFADADDGLGFAALPPGAPEHAVAIEVEGYSMGFIAEGALIFYSDRMPPDDGMLGSIMVVGLDDGAVLLKRLLRGSREGLYDLESVNGPLMHDRRVVWAAHVDALVPPWRASRIKVDADEGQF